MWQPLKDIRYTGDWSINSTVLKAKHLHFKMPQSRAAYVFFGNLKRDIAAERERASSLP